MRNQPILEVTDLQVTFTGSPAVHAVRGVGLQVARGERVGIVGESGSGKSTTALSLLRLHDEARTSYGSDSVVRYRDQNLLSLSQGMLRTVRGAGIAMVFQNPLSSLSPVYRVGKQIESVIRAHRRHAGQKTGARREVRVAALEALRAAGISDADAIFERFPHELSGGLRQRALIAMAMSCNPEILVADEPTSALDATIQRAVLSTFCELSASRGMALLLITHDIGVVSYTCERVYVMSEGRVVEEGKTDDVIRSPKHAYTKELLGSRFRQFLVEYHDE